MNRQGLLFENIHVGDEIPPLTKDITQVGMLMYSAATWDFARVHYDKEYAQGRGLQTTTIDGQMLGAYLAQMIMDWIDDSATLKKMDFRQRKMVFPGDKLTYKGKVTEKHTENGQKLITCDLWAENQNGEKIIEPASALISF